MYTIQYRAKNGLSMYEKYQLIISIKLKNISVFLLLRVHSPNTNGSEGRLLAAEKLVISSLLTFCSCGVKVEGYA